MTRQEAASILRKFEENLAKWFVLDIMNINKDATLGNENVQRLVRLVHDALPWPDSAQTNKEAILLDALQHVAANCGPCKTDHAGPALERYEKILTGDTLPPLGGNEE